MAEKHYEPPLSGELILGRRPSGGMPSGGNAPRGEILDAEYETLDESAAARSPVPAAQARGLDLLRHCSSRKAAPDGNPSGPTVTLIACFLAAGAFWLSGGAAALLDSATARQKPPLQISALETRMGAGNGEHLLFVRGQVVNDSADAHELPDLSINILHANGETTRYFLGTNGRALAGGGRFAFSSHMVAPKEDVKSVSVTFRE